jgi:hypothetical protein
MGFFIGAGKLTEWTQREFQNDGYVRDSPLAFPSSFDDEGQYRRSNNLDDFELELVKRDYRLTGVFRRQSVRWSRQLSTSFTPPYVVFSRLSQRRRPSLRPRLAGTPRLCVPLSCDHLQP